MSETEKTLPGAPKDFDLIVVGGGIYGVMLALEASLRDLRVLILERDEWGSGTTNGWLRILHGGLRYLQTADLPRFFESVRERRWFMQHFPEFVAPLPCVMPLYRTNSHPPALMRAALAANDLLSTNRNKDVADIVQLPAGRVISATDVMRMLPYVGDEDLRAGALWYDGIVLQPGQLLSELLRWAQSHGCQAMSRTEVVEVLRDSQGVRGVEAISGTKRERFEAPIVFNMTGHSSMGFARRAGLPMGEARSQSWAWNILFDVPYPTTAAGAMTARRSGAQTFFVVPWQGKALVGTGHRPVLGTDETSPVPEHCLDEFIDQVREAAPGLGLSRHNMAEVLQGRLPVSPNHPDELSSRPLIVDHADQGCAGFFTVWGIKFTTARAVAQRALKQAFGSRLPGSPPYARPSN